MYRHYWTCNVKKGIVKFTIPGERHFPAMYHFDPAYKLGNGTIIAKTERAAASSTQFFLKEPGQNDYDLAFKAFILNSLGIRGIKKFNMNVYFELIDKNRKKIFDTLFL